jgi:hypothetical protein
MKRILTIVILLFGCATLKPQDFSFLTQSRWILAIGSEVDEYDIQEILFIELVFYPNEVFVAVTVEQYLGGGKIHDSKTCNYYDYSIDGDHITIDGGMELDIKNGALVWIVDGESYTFRAVQIEYNLQGAV